MMDLELIKGSTAHASIIKNLMQFYMYDFSEFITLDLQQDGLFTPYPDLDGYWQEKNRFAYLVIKNGKYAGFVLVKFISMKDRGYFSMAEFFIVKSYRKQGIGRAVAQQIFNLHAGYWEVFQKNRNMPAQLFWREVIDEYTQGDFAEHLEDGRVIQNFKTISKPVPDLADKI